MSFCAVSALPCSPFSRVTSWVCALRFASRQTAANCWLAGDDGAHLAADEALEAFDEWPGQRLQVGRGAGRQSLAGDRVERLPGDGAEVDGGEDLPADRVGDSPLDDGIVRQRGDGVEVTVGVGDLAARPDCGCGQGG